MPMLHDNELSGAQKFIIHAFGPLKIGRITMEGWKGSLPLYACSCEQHGYFSDYPHGYRNYFLCPECSREWAREAEKAQLAKRREVV